MKKVLFLSMLIGALTVITCCTAESPYDDIYGWEGGENGYGMGGGTSTTTGELTTFDIALDRTTAEPTAVATEYFPDEEDILENNTFSIEIPIDLSNPEAKTVSGGSTVALSSYTGNSGGPGQGGPGQGGGPGARY